MYLARYTMAERDVFQAVVHFDTLIFEQEHETRGWWAHFARLVHQVLIAPGVDFAFRVNAVEGRLERLLMIVAAGVADEAEFLRSSFFTLNTFVGDSVTPLPAHKNEHDDMVSAFPRQHWKLRREVYPYNGFALVNDFRLFSILEDLLQAAIAHHWSFAYQVNVRRERLLPDDLRWLKKHLVRVLEDRSLPRPLVALQERVVQGLDRTSLLVDEFIGCGSDVASSRLAAIAGEAFAKKFAGARLPQFTLEAEQNGEFSDLIFTGFQSSLCQALSASEKAASAATDAEVEALLGWRPPAIWASLIENRLVAGERELDHLKRIEDRLARIERALDRQKPPPAPCAGLKEAVVMSRADPRSALPKIRVIVESIVQAIYLERKPGQRIKPLYEMIENLATQSSPFPKRIVSYLHTLRTLGNLGAHAAHPDQKEQPPSDTDVEIGLLMLLEVVGWYLLQYSAGENGQAC